MKLTSAAIFILLLTTSTHLVCQNFAEEFITHFEKNDTLAQRLILEKWEAAKPEDAEMYIAWFNFYVTKSESEIIRLGDDPKGEDVLEILDTDSSNKEPVAYMYGETYYDPEVLAHGLDYISEGIKKHPNRLDMRFGKVHVFGLVENYQDFTQEIINTISYSPTINNAWHWSANEAMENPKEFMLETIQNYALQLYNTGDDALLNNMAQIAETILKYEPNHVESLSNLSIVYTIHEDYDKSLEYLLKAEKIAPQDYIVLMNIANNYKMKNDKSKSIGYYKKAIKYGDEDAKAYSKSQIEELKR